MRTFGLIGKTLGHSFSPGFFNEKFTRENLLDCNYQLFPLREISEIKSLIHNNPALEGLNVTIPYKKSIIPFLDEISADAKQIGAVNTIKIIRSPKGIKLIGFNSDAIGFLTSCEALRHRPATLILGTGGSAQAVKFILEQFNISFLSVSRNPKNNGEIRYAQITKAILQAHHLIINTTPLGMFPNIEACPQLPYDYLSEHHFLYDLIYNPEETSFLKKGRAAGAGIQNGELMLRLQAEKSWEIWNS